MKILTLFLIFLTGCGTVSFKQFTVDACKPAILIDMDLNISEDKAVYSSARKRCGLIYNGYPCVKSITKVEEHVYRVICIPYEERVR